MSRDLSLEDLAGGSSGGSGGSGGSDSSDLGWLTDLYDRAQQDGYIDMFAQHYLGDTRDMSEIQQEAAGQTADTETNTTDMTADITAEKVQKLLLKLYDHSGQVPGLSEDPKLSEVIKLVDANPEMANKLIEQHL